MYPNYSDSRNGLALPYLAPRPSIRALRFLLLVASVVFTVLPARAQTGGEAGIQGTVTDNTGSAIPNATVTAINNASGTTTVRQTSGAGLFTISPILPGTYTVTVSATGFQSFRQENFSIDALRVTGLNVTMTIGSTATESPSLPRRRSLRAQTLSSAASSKTPPTKIYLSR